MFRDTREELERLQAQLLEETQEQSDQTQEFLEEEDFDALLSDTDQGENPPVYQNYSNDYGKNLRNYATGYQAYNADKTDVDMEQYSQEVLRPQKATGAWLWIVLLLMAAAVGAILWLLFSTGGLF